MPTEETPDADTTGQFAATDKPPFVDPRLVKLLKQLLAVGIILGGMYTTALAAQSTSDDGTATTAAAAMGKIQGQLEAIILTLDGDGKRKKGLSEKMDFLGQRQDAGYREARELQRLSGYESEMMEFRRRERRHKDRPTWDQVSNR